MGSEMCIRDRFYQKKGETAKTSDAEQTHSLFTENAEQSAETAEKKEEVSEVTSEQPEDAVAEEVKQEETVNTEAAEQPAKQEENFLGNESEPNPEEPQEELSEEEKETPIFVRRNRNGNHYGWQSVISETEGTNEGTHRTDAGRGNYSKTGGRSGW